MDIHELVKEHGNILRPFGEIEVLLYYRLVAEKLREFLGGKELAARNWVRGNYNIMKRGSELEPLYIEDLIEGVTPEFLRIRHKSRNLEKARSKINKRQELIWRYFLPRKLSDFFYAPNHEGEDKPIGTIYYDIDIGEGLDSREAQEVTRELVKIIKEDSGGLDEYTPWVSWTGASFHVYLFLEEKKRHQFYEENVKFSKNTPVKTLTERWIQELKGRTQVPVIGGHEEVKGKINIDPSQTPSGKLDRAPFSLHVANAERINGISLPIKLEELRDENLIERLNSYTPEKVVEELDFLAKKLPS